MSANRSIALVMPRSTFLEDSMVMMPLGLMYIAARLESLGHTTEFFDLNVDDFPEDVYDEIWVSATSPQMAEIKRIGKMAKEYDAKFLIGGASAWADPSSCMDLGYDLAVGGEVDEPENIKRVLSTEKGYLLCPVSKTLDWVLPPVRRWGYKYHSALNDLNGNKRPCITMFTSRGCPLECAFCESGRHGVIWDRLTRYEPLDVVEIQLQQCATLGYHALAMYDDILPLNKKRTLKMLELFKEYDMIWRCFLRSDIINNQGGREYLEQMRDGGLVEIFVGVESADNRIKENITKKTTIEQDSRIIEWCKDLGIRCKASLIMGLPGESKESIQKTLDWVLKYRPDRVQWGRIIPFPGTPLFKNPQNYDMKVEYNVPDDWFYMGNNDFNHSFVSTSNLTVKEIDDEWHRVNKILQAEGISS